MNNTFVFLASFFSAAFAMWLIAVLPHKIDNWLRVRRRVKQSVAHPPKVRTTIHTAPSANPAAKPAVMIITDFPLISHDPYVVRTK